MARLLSLLKWCGFTLSLAALGVALAWAADVMRPIGKGNAREFWSGVGGVPLREGEPHHRLHFRLQEPYIYDPSVGGIPLHGDHYSGVSEAEVMREFPGVLDRILADPSALSLKQIQALIGDKVGDRESGLSKLAADRDEIGRSSEKMGSFIRASYEEWLTELASRRQSGWEWVATSEILDAQRLTARLDRARHYWATIAFDAIFLSGLVTFFWLPLLWTRARRWLPVIWGSLPVVFLVPYFLGYCRMAIRWPDAHFWGGPLYSLLLQIYRPLGELARPWDLSLWRWLPQVLEPLNQPSMVDVEKWIDTDYGSGGVGPIVPAMIGLVIGLAAYGLQRLARKVRRREETTSQPC
jgi:hypothetical protein